jgi:hypothetical protein
VTVRPCAHCGKDFTPVVHNQKYHHPDCKRQVSNAARRADLIPEKQCSSCGKLFTPRRQEDGTCSPRCAADNWNSKRAAPAPDPSSRRCRNKNCIERFVPVNLGHWFHEAACAAVPPEEKWSQDEILREEGNLLPDANQGEMAKRAFGQKNQLLRKVEQLTSFREYLTYLVQDFHDDNPAIRHPAVTSPSRDKGDKSERELVVQLSDWQVGKWEDGFGVAATMARVDEIKGAIVAIVQRQRDAGYPMHAMTLSFGGDMIEGCFIYRGQNVSGLDKQGNSHRLTNQIYITSHAIAEIATFCSTLVELVKVKSVGGNHGRPNGPNDYADTEDNFDVMSAWWAKDITVANDRIEWETFDNWWGSFDVMGHTFVSLHGDQWPGQFGALNKLLPLWIANGEMPQDTEILLTHHRHEEKMAEIAHIRVYQNGTIDAGSKWYLKKYGKKSTPHQRILVVSENHAPEADWPIQFDDVIS